MIGEVYHAGERLAQALAGETERPERIGRSIRPVIPAVAAAFLAERQIISSPWPPPTRPGGCGPPC